MNKKILSTLVLCLFITVGFGQNKSMSTAEDCGSALIHDQLMKSDPDYKARILANEKQIQDIINHQKSKKEVTLATVYTIPVVVHVIHNGEAVGTGVNISTAQIQSAIDNLTDAYRNQSPYTGVDVEVEFALAVRDPFCNSTTGIIRVNGSGVTNYSTQGIAAGAGAGAIEADVKALSRWPNNTYYNIWIVNEIQDNNGGAGIQGYAYFPGAGPTIDGAVILYNAFGYDPTAALGYNLKSYTNMNVTTIHELGHGFNLYHSFEGDVNGTTCPGNASCSADGDLVCDTPPHIRSASNCNTAGTNACDGGSSNTLFVHNFMDYSSDVCQTEFTTDQKTRMRAAITTTRVGLTTSLALTPVSGSQPAVAQTCQPNTTDLANNYAMGVYEFKLGNLVVSSSGAVGDGGYVENWCANTTVNVNTTYSVSVTNKVGLNPEDVRVYIDYNNDGDFADAGEQIFSSDNATSHNGTFTTPVSPVTGTPIWVRVISDYTNNTISGGCYTPQYGQAEDYSLTINSGGSAPIANFTASATTVCSGASVNFTDQSTNTPTSWSWNFQGGTPSTATTQNPSISYTAAGTYSVSLTATNGIGNDNETKLSYITVNAKPVNSATVTNVSCNGGSNGSVDLSVAGGTSPYTYSWNPGGQTTQDRSSLAVGSYTVLTTDNKGCTDLDSYSVTQPAVLSATMNKTNVSCSGGTDGSASASPSGGTAPYAYSWNPGGQTTSARSSLAAGNYSCVVTDNKGCVYTGTVSVTQPAVLSVLASKTDSCSASGGSATATPSGGTSPYTYSWSPGGQTTAIITGLSQRNYTCSVTDNKGCAAVTGTVSVGSSACGPTSLAAAYCGVTVSTLGQALYSIAVPGATKYQYKVTHPASGFTGYYTRAVADNYFQMSYVAGIQINKTYNVEVCAYVGGVWGNFGSICTVTTPASVPSTSLAAAYCGITLSTLGQALYSIAVPGATQFQYKVTHPASGFTGYYTRSVADNYFQMNYVTGTQINKTYNVEVCAYVGGIWGTFGSVCTVTTPVSTTSTSLASAYCGITLSILNQALYCTAVAGATSHQYRVTHAASGFTGLYTRAVGDNYFQMNYISGIQYNKTYTVEVRAYAGGVWGNFGSICTVTTPGSIPNTSLASGYCGITLGTMSQAVYSTPVTGAMQYQYQVLHAASGFTGYYVRGVPDNYFQMNYVSGIQVARNYTVQVRANVGGVWGSFGPVCTVTTPPFINDPGNDQAKEVQSGPVDPELNVFPNPVSEGPLFISLQGITNDQEVVIDIFSISGTKIYSEKIKHQDGTAVQVDLDTRFVKGVYFVTISYGNIKMYKKFVVSR